MKPEIKIIDDLSPEDGAMVQALYSRSPASVEDHLVKVDRKGSGGFMSQFYVNYGHKSIGDCGTTDIFVEGVTMLVAKAIQDWPLYSGQEASTRYMDFSKSEFFNPLGNNAGEMIQDNWRTFYLNSQEPVRRHIREQYPRQNGEDEKVYERSVSARAFDILRSFLPAGAATNLSWHTNLRQADDHLIWLNQHPEKLTNSVSYKIFDALSNKYKHSFKQRGIDEKTKFYEKVLNEYYYLKDLYYNDDIKLTFSLDIPGRIIELLKERPRGVEIPWFLAELGMVKSEFSLDFGSFRDLQRHRNGVVRMPLLTTDMGFEAWYLNQLPADLQDRAFGLLEDQVEMISRLQCDPITAQNYIAMGFLVPCRVTQSLPAFIYRVELRSGKTVHPTLRRVVHKEIILFKERYPDIPLHVDEDPDSWTIRRGMQTIEEKK